MSGGPGPLRPRLPPGIPAGLGEALETAALAAVAGGRAVRRLYLGRKEVEVETKAPGDPVTEADRASEEAVLEVLRARSPGLPVLSEESPPPPGAAEAERLWVVDPLDGTKEFLARNGEFAVMVGLASAGRCLLGALYLPEPELLYLGVAAGGAWRAPVPADGEGPTGEGAGAVFAPLREGAGGDAGPLRLVRSRSHPDPVLALVEARAAREWDAVIVPCGSAGVKCARVAEAEADVYVHPVPYLKEWDTCAPEAVVRGAGGRVTDCGGGPLLYGKASPRQPRGILAARAGAWSRVAPVVREAAADMLSDEAGPESART